MPIPKTYFLGKTVISNQIKPSLVLVFKTSVTSKKDIKSLTPALNKALPNNKWNFDLDDCDNIFRVENSKLPASRIIQIFDEYGFNCEELE